MPGQTISKTWQHDPTISAPPRYRRACRYDAFIPVRLADLPLSLEMDVAGAVSEAESAIQGLNGSAASALAPLARLLLRTEAIASSKVEGMQVGSRQLARAESRLESGGNAGTATLEILANIDAMELAVYEAATAERLTEEGITAIHRKLMGSAPNAHIAGKLRTTQNWIGGNDYNPCGADFVPPPPEHIDELLTDLCRSMNEAFLPPLVQAALIHAQFETIHPFADGNGRTGRALVHVILRRRGIAPSYVPPISVILSLKRDRYIAGLTRFREDGVAEWVGMFARATSEAAHLATSYLHAVQELTQRWRNQLSGTPSAPRGDAVAWAIIDVLPAHPMITAPVAAAVTGRSKPQVYQALRQLEEAEVLVPLSASKRNQSWEAVGLLDLLDGLESGVLPTR